MLQLSCHYPNQISYTTRLKERDNFYCTIPKLGIAAFFYKKHAIIF
jgi:hypothetical protein